MFGSTRPAFAASFAANQYTARFEKLSVPQLLALLAYIAEIAKYAFPKLGLNFSDFI